MSLLEHRQVVPKPRAEVFSFFERPENLQLITPSFLAFEVLTPSPVPMHDGAIIDYRLSLHGLPLRWQSKIESVQPGERFIDRQLKGPYASWVHLHEFSDHREGTEIRDRVEYQLPLGPLGRMAHSLFVKRQLRAIFSYRRQVIEERFGRSPGELSVLSFS